jgi:hypothetical protein
MFLPIVAHPAPGTLILHYGKKLSWKFELPWPSSSWEDYQILYFCDYLSFEENLVFYLKKKKKKKILEFPLLKDDLY